MHSGAPPVHDTDRILQERFAGPNAYYESFSFHFLEDGSGRYFGALRSVRGSKALFRPGLLF